MYAQPRTTDTGALGKAVERAVLEAEAKQRRAAEEARRKEQKKEQRHEQQRRQHEAQYTRQMNNLNSVSAGDYMTGPRQQYGTQRFHATTHHAAGGQTPPVTTQRKNGSRQVSGNNGSSSGRSNFGTYSYSGNNYTGDRYNIRPAGFDDTRQLQQVRKPAEQIRGQYKPGRTMSQGVISTRQTNIPTRVSVHRSPRQNNNQNAGSVQAPRTSKSQQALRQQRTAQSVAGAQTPQKRQIPVGEQVGTGRIVNIDPSKGLVPNTGQDNSSPDLTPVEIPNSPGSRNRGKMQAFALPQNEAPYLSDRDIIINAKKIGSGRTDLQQFHMHHKDLMNGMRSFENQEEWDYIYNVSPVGKVKNYSRMVRSNR